MKRLNLINPDNSSLRYEVLQFPDGEPHIKLYDFDRKDEVLVMCRICNPTDLFILMQVGDILNRQGVPFALEIYYLMSMRMDRVMSYNESFSLKVVTDMINSICPLEVHVLEPHSYRVGQLLDSFCCNIAHPTPDFNSYLRVYPDKGAADRYEADDTTDLICSKVRDSCTGHLSGFNIENPEVLTKSNLPFMVIDDLCDGGGTFKGVAELLNLHCPNREKVIYVTHMVNYKGIITLSENYDKVFFTNSYKDWENASLPTNVEVIKVV